MGNGSSVVARQMGRLFEEGTLAGLSEGELLERFLARRDESAFAVLVDRHGSLVMGVCRRVLGDAHEAEDAFQATFLLLVRKAGSIRHQKLLGGWLHRVAYRVATRAGQSAARRRAVEKVDSEVAERAEAPEGPSAEVTRVVHEEIARLSDNDRAAVVLCDLEGLTHSEAAARLNWPVGTVKGRLFRARERLKGRLVRRGLTLPAGLVAATLANEARAGVSRALVASTVQAAAQVAAGQAVSGAVSASAIALAGGVARTMMVSKMKIFASLFLAGGIVVAGAGAVLLPGEKGAGGDPVAAVEALEREDLASRIVGTWELKEGEIRPDRQLTFPIHPGNVEPKFGPFVFREDGTCTVNDGQGRYRVDAGRNPAGIDLFLGSEKENVEPASLGIFRISDDGQTLTLYYSEETRPKDFEERGDEQRILFTMTRRAEEPEKAEEAQAKPEEPEAKVAAKAEANGIEGVWKIRYVERNGAIVSHRAKFGGTVPSAVRFKDGVFELHEPIVSKALESLPREASYQVFAGKTPLEIDLDQRQPGIYRVDGDTMTLCMYSPDAETPALYQTGDVGGGDNRPTGFETNLNDGRLLMVLERGTEEDFAPKERPANELVGTWKIVEMIANGKHQEEEIRSAGEWVILPGWILWKASGAEVMKYELKPEASPKEIDTHSDLEDLQGIYERHGELLRLCLAPTETREATRVVRGGPGSR